MFGAAPGNVTAIFLWVGIGGRNAVFYLTGTTSPKLLPQKHCLNVPTEFRSQDKRHKQNGFQGVNA